MMLLMANQSMENAQFSTVETGKSLKTVKRGMRQLWNVLLATLVMGTILLTVSL